MKLRNSLLILTVLALLCCGCGGGSKKPAVEIDPSAMIIDPNATEIPASPIITPPPETKASPAPITENFPTQAEMTELAEEDIYTFRAGDIKILPRMEAAPILEALGDPAFKFEADSCAYQGKDIYYKYNGYELTVNTPDCVPMITAITIVDDTIRVPFPNGTLAIGDNVTKLGEVFGLEPGQEQYDLHSPGVHLQIAVKDNRVSAILFLAPEEY